MATAPLSYWDSEGNPNYTAIGYDENTNYAIGYQDKNGNIWNSIPALKEDGGYTEPKLVLSGDVANDPYIASISLARQDTSAAQALYDLKKSNPSQFYNQAASLLNDKIYSDWRINNTNYSTQVARDLLEGIKSENPQAYYTAKLTDLGRNVGWQIGQNRNDRNAPTIEQIKSLVPDAMKAGLSASQIDSIVGNNVNAANSLNQQRIANEAASGNFWSENLLGAAKVGAFALGAGGLDAALNAGATGMNGALQSYLGTTGGAFVPAEGFSATLPGFSAGASAITQALPYTEAYDAANLASQGLNSAAIEQNLAATGLNSFLSADMASLAAQGLSESQIASTLAASYTPAELAGTGIESLNWAGAGANAGPLSNAGNLLKGASLAKGLLGAGKNPAVNQPMGVQPMQSQQRQYAGVDYSPILNLLAVKSPERTRTSLLG